MLGEQHRRNIGFVRNVPIDDGEFGLRELVRNRLNRICEEESDADYEIKALAGNYASVISNVVYTDPLARFLFSTSEFVPQLAPRFGNGGNKVLPKNGGVESVETAIKMARYYGWKEKGIPDGQQEIIVFGNNFHGRMITVISFSSEKAIP